MSKTIATYFDVRNGIARKMVLRIFLFSSLITFLSTSLQLTLDYFRDVRLIEDRMGQIEKSHLDSIVNSLWVSDMEQIGIQLEGISRLPDMRHLEIRTKGKRVAEVGIPQDSRIVVREFPLPHTFRGKELLLGTLRVTATLDGVYQRLLDKVFVILVTQTVKTFLVSLFIFFLFYSLVGRHLAEMGNYARTLDTENLEMPLVLRRSSGKREGKDELDQLVISVNEMRTNLRASLGRIRQMNEELETRVRERTAELSMANEEILALNERLKEENLRMAAELDVTRRIQQMILPTEEELGRVEGLDIVGFMKPADEVGGDYYDVLSHDGSLKIGIGDVTGHGLESGVIMLMTQTAVRTLLLTGEKDPARFLNILNRTIYDNVRRMKADKSLTLAILDYRKGLLRLSGQHEDMIVVRKDGEVELVDTVRLGIPLGLVDEIAHFVAEASVTLKPGDGVVLYSDGITEAENMDGEFYGQERLCQIISRNWGQPAEAIKQAVIEDIRRFIGEQVVYDDITLLVMKQR